MNYYRSGSAQPEHIRDEPENLRISPRRPGPKTIRPPSPLSGLSGELGKMLSRLDPSRLETEDLLIFAVLWLMYRESRDEELLITMAAMLFL